MELQVGSLTSSGLFYSKIIDTITLGVQEVLFANLEVGKYAWKTRFIDSE
jgi:hypothetical protein